MWDLGDLLETVRNLEADLEPTPMTNFQGHILKREDLQTSGSFKWRGVLAELSAVPCPPRGLVAVSTGNTGKAVALAARMRSIEAHVFCAGEPAAEKRRYIHGLQGHIHHGFGSFSEASVAAKTFASSREYVFISPGTSWRFAYGAASLVSEILATAPETTVLLAPIGGGGLVSGLGLGLRAFSADVRLIGVQAANSPYVYNYFHQIGGSVRERPTVADCLAGNLEPEALILEVGHDVLDDVVVVSDRELLRTARALERTGIRVEPGAAAALAAANLSHVQGRWPEARVCCLISGGG